KSLNLQFPVFEYTPFRSFSTQIAFGLLFQIGFGAEIPLSTQLEVPASGVPPHIGTAWSIFIRAQADGRYFFGSREDLQPPRGWSWTRRKPTWSLAVQPSPRPRVPPM